MTPEEIGTTIANTTNPVDGWRKVLADRITHALAASEQRGKDALGILDRWEQRWPQASPASKELIAALRGTLGVDHA